MRAICTIILLLCLSGCDPKNAVSPLPSITYSPVYTSPESANMVSVEPAKPTTVAGKIYAYNNYLFQNDVGTGIHIIDNTNRQLPKKIAFLQVPFSTEVAVKGNFLYSNSFSDLVVFDISNPAKPVLANRIAKIFPAINQQYPPYNNVYFECPDRAKGVVTAWVVSTVKNAKCRR